MREIFVAMIGNICNISSLMKNYYSYTIKTLLVFSVFQENEKSSSGLFFGRIYLTW